MIQRRWKSETRDEGARGEEREREAKRSWGVYNATIAGCDRSCELRAGNLGVPCTRISATRIGDEDRAVGGREATGGKREGWMGRDEREEGSNANARVRGCIDTSLRRRFVIL